MKVTSCNQCKDISVKVFGNIVVISCNGIKIELSKEEAIWLSYEVMRLIAQALEKGGEKQ